MGRIGRDLHYDLGTDPDHIVPADAVVANDKTNVNAKIVWTLDKKAEWTKFTYNFNISNWFGTDPGTGEPNTGKCVIMFENTSYIKDDGTISYVDNLSVYKKGIFTSIAKSDKAGINIYPNPVANSITLNGLNPGTQIEIYSFSGQVVKRLRYNGQPIDVSSYNKGGYFIRGINDKGAQLVGKFIKE